MHGEALMSWDTDQFFVIAKVGRKTETVKVQLSLVPE